MSAEMYRLIGGQVVAGKGMTFFELPGTARKALPSSATGNYILGDGEGQGTMALMGDKDEIAVWLGEHSDVAIENRSDLEAYGMDDIQVIVSSCEYTAQQASSKDVKSLNPVGDSIVAIITGVARFSPSPPVVEVISGITEVVDAVTRKKPKQQDGRRPAKDLQVIFQLAGAGEGTMTAYQMGRQPKPFMGVTFGDLTAAIDIGIGKLLSVPVGS
jgi:hypothetical protein